jgi:signal recognition particle receptor subunit beta
MVQINFALKEVNCKIVFYGPGMSGKTTNLEIVHQKAPESNKGTLTSISTDGDRTLFFDFMPLDLGTVAGMRTKFQLYTVPGQVYYNSTRKLVLQGVDGVIFVADSDPDKLSENIESYDNLIENLAEYGKDARELPHVIQYNKRDLPNAMTVEDLDKAMNKFGVPTFEAVAHTGEGVFPTLKTLAGMVLESIDRMDHRRKSPAQKEAARTPEPQRAPAVRRPAQPGAAQRQRQRQGQGRGQGPGKPKQGGPRRQVARPKGQKKGQQPRRGRGAPSGSRPALARQRRAAPREDAPLRRGNGGMNLLIFLVVLLAAGIAGVVYFIMNNPGL